MGILTAITRLDRTFGWSFLGFLLAIVFGAMSIYTEFWKESLPRLEFEMLSNAPVLDVREKLPELEVIYQSQDIAKSGNTLSVLLVRVINRGSANILSTFYDSRSPVGLDLVTGSLIRANVLDTSNEYLRSTASVAAKDSSVTIVPVILERGEWFVIKLLVLHKVGYQPKIEARGKVAGQRNILVVPSEPTVDRESFSFRAFSGTLWVQLARMLAYFVAAALCMALMIGFPSMVASSWTNRKRRNLVRQFRSTTKLSLSKSDEFIFEGFMRNGVHYVQRLTNGVADIERLQRIVTRYLEDRGQSWQGPIPSPDVLSSYEQIQYITLADGSHARGISGHYIDIKAMIEHGFIVNQDDQWIVVSDRLKVATSFIEFIEVIGATKV